MIQDKKKYFEQLKKELKFFVRGKKGVKIFLFGSAIKHARFADIDVGITGKITDKEISSLKELFEESIFPFKVDIVNFNTARAQFKRNVLSNGIVWIKR